MTAPPDRPFRTTHLDDLERVRLGDLVWRPIRRPMDITAFGVNAYSADEAGAVLISRHDEKSAGAGGHEELYLVVSGQATFTVAGEEVDAPAGTLLFIPPGVVREAVARAAATTVVVVGGRPGAGLPVSPFEHWDAAQPAYEAGDFDSAVAIVSEGLRDWPDHGTIHYQLACYHALAGRREEALRHLHTAYENDPRTREWAVTDTDLDAIRDDPRFAAE